MSDGLVNFPVGAAAKNESAPVEKKKRIALKVKKPDAASAAAYKVKEAEDASPKNSKVAAKDKDDVRAKKTV